MKFLKPKARKNLTNSFFKHFPGVFTLNPSTTERALEVQLQPAASVAAAQHAIGAAVVADTPSVPKEVVVNIQLALTGALLDGQTHPAEEALRFVDALWASHREAMKQVLRAAPFFAFASKDNPVLISLIRKICEAGDIYSVEEFDKISKQLVLLSTADNAIENLKAYISFGFSIEGDLSGKPQPIILAIINATKHFEIARLIINNLTTDQLNIPVTPDGKTALDCVIFMRNKPLRQLLEAKHAKRCSADYNSSTTKINPNSILKYMEGLANAFKVDSETIEAAQIFYALMRPLMLGESDETLQDAIKSAITKLVAMLHKDYPASVRTEVIRYQKKYTEYSKASQTPDERRAEYYKVQLDEYTKKQNVMLSALNFLMYLQLQSYEPLEHVIQTLLEYVDIADTMTQISIYNMQAVAHANLENCLKSLEIAEKHYPDQKGEILYYAGYISSGRQDFEKAKSYYREALKFGYKDAFIELFMISNQSERVDLLEDQSIAPELKLVMRLHSLAGSVDRDKFVEEVAGTEFQDDGYEPEGFSEVAYNVINQVRAFKAAIDNRPDLVQKIYRGMIDLCTSYQPQIGFVLEAVHILFMHAHFDTAKAFLTDICEAHPELRSHLLISYIQISQYFIGGEINQGLQLWEKVKDVHIEKYTQNITSSAQSEMQSMKFMIAQMVFETYLSNCSVNKASACIQYLPHDYVEHARKILAAVRKSLKHVDETATQQVTANASEDSGVPKSEVKEAPSTTEVVTRVDQVAAKHKIKIPKNPLEFLKYADALFETGEVVHEEIISIYFAFQSLKYSRMLMNKLAGKTVKENIVKWKICDNVYSSTDKEEVFKIDSAYENDVTYITIDRNLKAAAEAIETAKRAIAKGQVVGGLGHNGIKFINKCLVEAKTAEKDQLYATEIYRDPVSGICLILLNKCDSHDRISEIAEQSKGIKMPVIDLAPIVEQDVRAAAARDDTGVFADATYDYAALFTTPETASVAEILFAKQLGSFPLVDWDFI